MEPWQHKIKEVDKLFVGIGKNEDIFRAILALIVLTSAINIQDKR